MWVATSEMLRPVRRSPAPRPGLACVQERMARPCGASQRLAGTVRAARGRCWQSRWSFCLAVLTSCWAVSATPTNVSEVVPPPTLTLQGTYPQSGAENVPLKDFSILLSFAEVVQAGVGFVVLQTGNVTKTTVLQIPCSSTPLFTDRDVFLPVRGELSSNILHTVVVPAACFSSSDGAILSAEMMPCDFTTISKGETIRTFDFIGPRSIGTMSPEIGTWVSSSASFVMYFSEAVQTANPLARILQTTADSMGSTVFDASPSIVVDFAIPGRVSITPAPLRPGAEYEMTFGAGTFKDLAGNFIQDSAASLAVSAATVKVSTDWHSAYPVRGASGDVSRYTCIVLDFDQTVRVSNHSNLSVSLCGDRSTGSDCLANETVSLDAVFILGTRMIINPPELGPGLQYNLTIPDSVIEYYRGMSFNSAGNWEYYFEVASDESAPSLMSGPTLLAGLVDCNGDGEIDASQACDTDGDGVADFLELSGSVTSNTPMLPSAGFKLYFREKVRLASAVFATLTADDGEIAGQVTSKLGSGYADFIVTLEPMLKTGRSYILDIPPGAITDHFNRPYLGTTFRFFTPLLILGSLPANGTTQVTRTTPIMLTFSQMPQIGLFPKGSTMLDISVRDTSIGGLTQYISLANPEQARFVGLDMVLLPQPPLLPGKLYEVHLKRMALKYLTRDFSFMFSTRSEDTVKPTVVFSHPSGMLGKIAMDATAPYVLFSESVTASAGHHIRLFEKGEAQAKYSVSVGNTCQTIVTSTAATTPTSTTNITTTTNTGTTTTTNTTTTTAPSTTSTNTTTSTSTSSTSTASIVTTTTDYVNNACVEFDTALSSMVHVYPKGKAAGGPVPWASGGATYSLDIEASAYSDSITTGDLLSNKMEVAQFTFSVNSDVIGPYILHGTPQRGAVDINPTLSSVTLTFNEVLQAGNNSIAIRSWDHHERSPALVSTVLTVVNMSEVVVMLTFDTAVQSGVGQFMLYYVSVADASHALIGSIELGSASVVANKAIFSCVIEFPTTTTTMTTSTSITTTTNTTTSSTTSTTNTTTSITSTSSTTNTSTTSNTTASTTTVNTSTTSTTTNTTTTTSTTSTSSTTNSTTTTNTTSTAVSTTTVVSTTTNTTTSSVLTSRFPAYYVTSTHLNPVENAAAGNHPLVKRISVSDVFPSGDAAAPVVFHSTFDDYTCMPGALPNVVFYLSKNIGVVNFRKSVKLRDCGSACDGGPSQTTAWSLLAASGPTSLTTLQVIVDPLKRYKVTLSLGSLPATLLGSSAMQLRPTSKYQILLDAGLLETSDPSLPSSAALTFEVPLCDVRYNAAIARIYSPVPFAPSASLAAKKFRVDIPQTALKDVLGNVASMESTYDFAHDSTPPVLKPFLSNPAHGRQDASIFESIVLTFSEVVQAGIGSFSIWESNGTAPTKVSEVDVGTIAANSVHGRNLISGQHVLISPKTLCTGTPACASLASFGTYHITTSASGVLKDIIGNELAKFDTMVSPVWSFSTGLDYSPPAVVFVGGTSLAGLQLTGYLYFSEQVTQSSTSIKLSVLDCGSDLVCEGDETSALSNAVLSFGDGSGAGGASEYGSMTYTLAIPYNYRRYKVTLPVGLVTDMSGLAGPTASYNFFVDVGAVGSLDLDIVKPVVQPWGYSPAHGMTHVSSKTNLVLHFNKDVQLGTGIVQFCLNGDAESLDSCLGGRFADGALAEFDIAQATVDHYIVTMDLPKDLAFGQTLYVLMPAGAIKDAGAARNVMEPISKSEYSFVVAEGDMIAPQLAYSSVPSVPSGNVTLILSEAVQKSSGQFTLIRGDVSPPVWQRDLEVTVSGNTATITSSWVPGGQYVLYLETDALQDLAGNTMAQDKYKGFYMVEVGEPDNATRCSGPNVSTTTTTYLTATATIAIQNGNISMTTTTTNTTTSIATTTFANETCDSTPPVFLSMYPPEGLVADLLANSSGIVIGLFFSEPVKVSPGAEFFVRWGVPQLSHQVPLWELALVAGNGIKVQVPSVALEDCGAFTLSVGNNSVVDAAGFAVEGFEKTVLCGVDTYNMGPTSRQSSLAFAISPDVTRPVATVSPSNNDISVNQNDIFTLKFKEVVQKGSGMVSIYSRKGGCLDARCLGGSSYVEAEVSELPLLSYTQWNSKVSVLVIDPLRKLYTDNDFTLRLPSTAFLDESGNAFEGLPSDFSHLVRTTLMKDVRRPQLEAVDLGLGGSPNPNFAAQNITLYFSEAVQRGPTSQTVFLAPSEGGSYCSGGGACLGSANCSFPCNYTAASTAVVLLTLGIKGSRVTLGGLSSLEMGKGYTLVVNAGSFTDLSDNKNSFVDGEHPEAVYVLRTRPIDQVGPFPISTFPQNGDTMVPTSTTIVITFNEIVQSGRGIVQIGDTSLPVNTCNFQLATMTCTQSGSLSQKTSYSVEFAKHAVLDAQGNMASESIDGFASRLLFRTIDLDYIAPTLISLNLTGAPNDPVLGKQNLAKGSILTLIFSEVVQAGQGTIDVADCSPGLAQTCYDGITETVQDDIISVDVQGMTPNSMLVFDGISVHVDKVDLIAGRLYSLRTRSIGVFKDVANQPFETLRAGFEFGVFPADITAPAILSHVPAAQEIASNADLTFYFSEAVQASDPAGYIVISDASTTTWIQVNNSDITQGSVTINGPVVRVMPFDNLAYKGALTVTMGDDVFEDFSSLRFAGVSYQFEMPPPCSVPPVTTAIAEFAQFDPSNSTNSINCLHLDANLTIPHLGECAFLCAPGWQSTGNLKCNKGVFSQGQCVKQSCGTNGLTTVFECGGSGSPPQMGDVCNASCVAGYTPSRSDSMPICTVNSNHVTICEADYFQYVQVSCTTSSSMPEAAPALTPELPTCTRTACGNFTFDADATIIYDGSAHALGEELVASCGYGNMPLGTTGFKFRCEPKTNMPGYALVEWRDSISKLPATAPCSVFACPEPEERLYGNISGIGNYIGDTRTLICQGNNYVSGGSAVAVCDWSTRTFRGMGYCVNEFPLIDLSFLLTFDEPVQGMSGSIIVKSGTVVQAVIFCSSAMEYVANYALLPIRSLLVPHAIHTVEIPSTCFSNALGQHVISNFNGYQFMTIRQGATVYTHDERNPESLAVHAALNLQWVEPSASFVIYFNEAVQQGDRTLTITQITALETQTFDQAPAVMFDQRIPGKVTVTPRLPLGGGAEYKLDIGIGCFQDAAGNYLEQKEAELGLGSAGYRLRVSTTLTGGGHPSSSLHGRVVADTSLILDFAHPVKAGTQSVTICSDWLPQIACNASVPIELASMIFLGNKVLLPLPVLQPGQYNLSIPNDAFSFFRGLLPDAHGAWSYSFTVDPEENAQTGGPLLVAGLVDCNGNGDLHNTTSLFQDISDTCDPDGDGIRDFVEMFSTVSAHTPMLQNATFKLFFQERVKIAPGGIGLLSADTSTFSSNVPLEMDTHNVSSEMDTTRRQFSITMLPNLLQGALHTLVLPDGAVTDLKGNSYAGTSFTLYTPLEAPTVTPVDGSINIPRTVSILLAFASEARVGLLAAGATNLDVAIRDVQSGLIVQNISLMDSNKVKFQGTQVLLIPAPPLEAGRSYRFQFPRQSIRYMTKAFSFSFSTRAEDIVKPSVLHAYPSGNLSIVEARGATPYILFSESVIGTSGKNVNFRDALTGELQYTIGATDVTCGYSGAISDSCLEIDPALGSLVRLYPLGQLPGSSGASWVSGGRSYYVEIEEGAFSDAPTIGSALANLMDAASFSFAVKPDIIGPMIVFGVPSRNAENVSPSANNVFLTFNENVLPGDNLISIRSWDHTGMPPTLSATSISGMVVMLTFDTAVQQGVGSLGLYLANSHVLLGWTSIENATFVSNKVIFNPHQMPSIGSVYYLSSSSSEAVRSADGLAMTSALDTRLSFLFEASPAIDTFDVLHSTFDDFTCLQLALPDLELYVGTNVQSLGANATFRLSRCGSVCSSSDPVLWTLFGDEYISNNETLQVHIDSVAQYKVTLKFGSLASSLKGSQANPLDMGGLYQLQIDAGMLLGAGGSQHLSGKMVFTFAVCEIRYDTPPSSLLRIYSRNAFAASSSPRRFQATLPSNSVLDLLGNALPSPEAWTFGHELDAPFLNNLTSNPPVDYSASTTENIVLSFSEVVQGGSGKFEIWEYDDDSAPKFVVDVATVIANSGGGHSLLSGNKVSITPKTLCTGSPACTALVANTTYYLKTSAPGVVKDSVGNKLPQLDTRAYWAFKTSPVDDRRPSVAFVGGTDSSGLRITGYIFFSERVRAVANSSLRLEIQDCGTDLKCSLAENLTSVSGVTVSYGAGLASAMGTSEYGSLRYEALLPRTNARYKVTVPAHLIEDDAGLTGPEEEYAFVLDQGILPVPVSIAVEDSAMTIREGGYSPPIGATHILPATDIVLHFNEDVQRGSGLVHFCINPDAVLDGLPACIPGLLADGTPATFDISGAAVQRRTLTMQIAGQFEHGQKIHVLIPSGIVTDAGSGQRAMPAVEAGSYHFTILEKDTIAPFLEYYETRSTGTSANISLFFSEAVQAVTGSIEVRRVTPSPETLEYVPITSVFGNNVRISSTWMAGASYKLRIAANAFQDLAGNAFSVDKYKGLTTELASAPETNCSNTTEASVCDDVMPEFVRVHPAAGLVADLPEDTDGIYVRLYFSKPVKLHTSNFIRIKWGSPETDHVIVNPALIQGNGIRVPVPRASLRLGTSFTVVVPGDVISDAAGNFVAPFERSWTCGGAAVVVLNISDDVTAPIASVIPSSGSTSVHGHDILALEFNELVEGRNGTVQVYSERAHANVFSARASDLPVVTFVKGGVLTSRVSVDFLAPLLVGNTYSLRVASDAFFDASSNAFAGLSSHSVTVVTHKDTVAPDVLVVDIGRSPNPTFTATSLTIYFTEAVQLGSSAAQLYLMPSSGGTNCNRNGACTPPAGCAAACGYTPADTAVPLVTWTLRGGMVLVTGITGLQAGRGYKLQIDAGKFEDLSGNPNGAVNGEHSSGVFVLQTPPLDMTGPVYMHASPRDGARLVATSTPISIMFNEAIQAGTGFLSMGSTQVGPDRCHFHNATMTCKPIGDLPQNSLFTVSFPESFVRDASGNPATKVLGLSGTHLSFSTIDRDFAPPRLLYGSAGHHAIPQEALSGVDAPTVKLPASSSGSTIALVSKSSVLALSFSEVVQAGSGSLIKADCSPGFPYVCYDGVTEMVSDLQETVSADGLTGGTKFVFDSTSVYIDVGDFRPGMYYSVQTSGDGFLTDLAANKLGQLQLGSGSFQFNVVADDTTNPTLLQRVPPQTLPVSEASVGTDITLYFSEAVQATGPNLMVTLFDGNRVRQIPVDNSDLASGQVVIYGSTVTINPTDDFVSDKAVSVSIDSGAFVDLSGNAFSGINVTDFQFRSAAFTFTLLQQNGILTSFSPRESPVVWSFGTSLMLYGGKTGDVCHTDLWTSTTGTDWSMAPPPSSAVANKELPAAAYAPYATDAHDCLWLLGGDCNSDSGILWKTCDGGKTWHPQPSPTVVPWGSVTPLPFPTTWESHAIAIVGGWQLVIVDAARLDIGGVWRFADSGATLVERVAAAPLPFQHRKDPKLLTTSDGTLYLLGGNMCTDTICSRYIFTDVWASHDAGATWTCQVTSQNWDTTLPHTRGFGQYFAAAIARDDDGMLLLGGQKAKSMDALNTVFSIHRVPDLAFTPSPLFWTPSDRLLPSDGGSVKVYFRENIEIGSGDIRLLDYGQDNAAGGTMLNADKDVPILISITRQVLSCIPKQTLVSGRQYGLVLLPKAVGDIAGNMLSSILTFEFSAFLPASVEIVTVTQSMVSSNTSIPNSTTTITTTTTTTTVTENIMPNLVTRMPSREAVATYANPPSTPILLTFDEIVQAGSGSILLTPTHLSPAVAVPVTDVVFDGSRVFVSPLQGLMPGEVYSVTIGAGVITDVSNNPYAGFQSGYTISTAPLMRFQQEGGAHWVSTAVATGHRQGISTVVDPSNNLFVIGGRSGGNSGMALSEVWRFAMLRETHCAASFQERTFCSQQECSISPPGALPTLGTAIVKKAIWRSPSLWGRRCWSAIDGMMASAVGQVLARQTQTCPCPSCFSPPSGMLPDNLLNTVYLTEYNVVSAARGSLPLKCRAGYVESANFTCDVHTLFTGKYQMPYPSCLSAPCTTPPNTSNIAGFATFSSSSGMVDCSKLSSHSLMQHGGFCTFECGPGWIASDVFRCELGAFTSASCTPQPCKIEALENGVLNCTSGAGALLFGQSCAVQCAAGHTPSAVNVSCEATLESNEASPALVPSSVTCAKTSCGEYEDASGAVVSYTSTGMVLGDAAHITCLRTHVPSGLVGLHLQCHATIDEFGRPEVEWRDTATGELAIAAPCRQVNCSEPVAPMNGSLVGQGTSPGDSRLLVCDDGFRVVGGASVTSCSATSETFSALGQCLSTSIGVIEQATVSGSLEMSIELPAGQSLAQLAEDVPFIDSLARSIAESFSASGVPLTREQITEVILSYLSGIGGRRLAGSKVTVNYKIKATSSAHASNMVSLLTDPTANAAFSSFFGDAVWRHTGLTVSDVSAAVPTMEVTLIYLTTPVPSATEQPTNLVDVDSSSTDLSGESTISSEMIIGIVAGGTASIFCILVCIWVFKERCKRLCFNKEQLSRRLPIGGSDTPVESIVPVVPTTLQLLSLPVADEVLSDQKALSDAIVPFTQEADSDLPSIQDQLIQEVDVVHPFVPTNSDGEESPR